MTQLGRLRLEYFVRNLEYGLSFLIALAISHENLSILKINVLNP